MDVNKHNFHECCCLYIFPLIRRQNSNYQCLKKPNLHCLSVSLTFSKATVREVREEFNNANNQKILQTSNQAFHKDYTKKNRPSCWFLGDIVSYCVCARQYIVRRFDNQSEVDDNIIYSDCSSTGILIVFSRKR